MELVSVGRVGRPHGVRGAFFVEEASEAEERFAPGATLLAGGQEVKVVERKHGAGGRLVLRLDRPVPRGTELAIPRESLPEPGEDTYYVFQLVGLAVEQEGGTELGCVVDVVPGVANDALELDSGLVLPLVEDCVLEVDLDAGRIVVARGFAAAD
jgi:16S rRNA processing protein RimM